jgi:hypothetical protein
VAQIAKVLSGHPGLDLLAKAQLASSDLRAARIAELRQRLSGGDQPANQALEPLRPLLEAESPNSDKSKETKPPDPKLEDELVKQIPFPAQGLEALGNARTEAVRHAFEAAASQAKAPPKVTVAPATPKDAAALDAAPGVYVELRAG